MTSRDRVAARCRDTTRHEQDAPENPSRSRAVIHTFPGSADRHSGNPDTQKTPRKQRYFSFVTQQTSSVTLRAPCHPAPRKTRRARPLSTQPEAPSAQACSEGPGALRAIATHAFACLRQTDPKVSFATAARAQMQRRTRSIRNSGFAVRISGCASRLRFGVGRAARQTDAFKLKRDLL